MPKPTQKEVATLLEPAAAKWSFKKSKFKCEEFAKAGAKALKKAGVKYACFEYKAPPGIDFVVHDDAPTKSTITENGQHYVIEVDGVVYDNLFPGGMAKRKWLAGLQSHAGGHDTFRVTKKSF